MLFFLPISVCIMSFSEKKRNELKSLISGSPRVEGDEEEDEFDDLDNEFDVRNCEAVLSSRLNTNPESANIYGFATPSEMDEATLNPDIPLLTYSQEVITQLITLYVHLL